MDRRAPAWVLSCAALLAGLSAAPVARAQSTPSPCPEAGNLADPAAPTPLEAAEQALCWYERERQGGPDCAPEAEARPSRCMSEVDAWCDHAALDTDPQVPNACFLARVRAGRHDDALRALALVNRAWPEVERCRRAYSEGLSLEVETTRGRVEVWVGGTAAGTSPTEVRVPHPWWQQRVEVGSRSSSRRTRREVVELSALFDPARCVLRPLVTTPAPEAAMAPGRTTRSDRATRARRLAPATVPAGSGRTAAWLVLGATGIALGLGGGTLLVVGEVQAADLRNASVGTVWTAAHDTRLDRIDAFRLAGGLLVGIATAALAGSVVGWWLDSAGSSEGR